MNVFTIFFFPFSSSFLSFLILLAQLVYLEQKSELPLV